VAIPAPLLSVAIASATHLHAWPARAAWVGGVGCLTALLLLQARVQRREAGDGLVDTLVIEIPGVTVPSLDYFRARIDDVVKADDPRKVRAKCRDGLLASASDLQRWLTATLRYGMSSIEDRAYFRGNTLYVIAQYFCWIQIGLREVDFALNLGDPETTEEFHRRLSKVRVAFATDHLPDEYRVRPRDQATIGRVMMSPIEHAPPSSPRHECLGYADFVKKLEDPEFARWFTGLIGALESVPPENSRRLVAIHDALVDLLALVDPNGERFPEARGHIGDRALND